MCRGLLVLEREDELMPPVLGSGRDLGLQVSGLSVSDLPALGWLFFDFADFAVLGLAILLLVVLGLAILLLAALCF